MAVIGIVSEYNPFHLGHLHHINESRRALGDDSTVVCVMSGDFVQRGEAAVYSKFARAEAACRCGADLVIELPLPWCLSSAENFARGALSLLSAAGADHISFGSEAGNLEGLKEIAAVLLDGTTTEEIKKQLSENGNQSFASARQSVLETRLGKLSELIKLPNNILAVEYLKANAALGLGLEPFTVCRVGAGHDITEGDDVLCASRARQLIRNGESADFMLPPEAVKVFAREKENGRSFSRTEAFEAAVLSRLRMFDKEYYSARPDAADGLGNRLWLAAHSEGSLDGVYASAKSKRYALSRIRRLCMCAALGVKEEHTKALPGYARVLAAKPKGFELLKQVDSERLKLISKPAAAKQLADEQRKIFELGANAHDMYVLGCAAQEMRRCGEDWRTSPFVLA